MIIMQRLKKQQKAIDDLNRRLIESEKARQQLQEENEKLQREILDWKRTYDRLLLAYNEIGD